MIGIVVVVCVFGSLFLFEIVGHSTPPHAKFNLSLSCACQDNLELIMRSQAPSGPDTTLLLQMIKEMRSEIAELRACRCGTTNPASNNLEEKMSTNASSMATMNNTKDTTVVATYMNVTSGTNGAAAPVSPPTESPTAVPTESPTAAPTESSGKRVCNAQKIAEVMREGYYDAFDSKFNHKWNDDIRFHLNDTVCEKEFHWYGPLSGTNADPAWKKLDHTHFFFTVSRFAALKLRTHVSLHLLGG